MWIKYKLDSRYTNALSYDDVFIVPQYSGISSRKEVDISTTINGKTVGTPIMNANMESIADEHLCGELKKAGGIPALHRFQSIESACKEYQNVISGGGVGPVFVSVGVNRDSKERSQELYNAGAREFIIDIAHGDSKQMCDMITWMKTNLPNCYILAGNVATGDAAEHLARWGADAVKCGIANGLVCVTKNTTGVVVPMFTCLQSCYNGKYNFEYAERRLNKKVALCADGGIREIGDICKALSFVDFVMSGKMFAGCTEAPGKGTYRGSASSEVQTMYRVDKEYVPTPEGKSIIVDATGETVGQIAEHIAGGIRSACSYVGARDLKDFQNKCTFGTRHNKS